MIETAEWMKWAGFMKELKDIGHNEGHSCRSMMGENAPKQKIFCVVADLGKPKILLRKVFFRLMTQMNN